MSRIREFVANEWFHYRIFTVLSLAAALCIGILTLDNKAIFKRFFGNLNPIFAITLTIVLGFVTITFLMWRGWFSVYRKKKSNGLLWAAGLATVMAIAMIVVDNIAVFSEDLNIAYPRSLLFYPSIAFVVEVIFHLLPLSILLLITTRLFKQADHQKLIWLCILLVSILEPMYQTVGFFDQYAAWVGLYVGLHLLVFNLLQLSLFRRYDFVTMLSFRLVYYVLWHIVWGYIRLQFFF